MARHHGNGSRVPSTNTRQCRPFKIPSWKIPSPASLIIPLPLNREPTRSSVERVISRLENFRSYQIPLFPSDANLPTRLTGILRVSESFPVFGSTSPQAELNSEGAKLAKSLLEA